MLLLTPEVTRLTTRGARRQVNTDRVALDARQGSAVKLHRADAVADLKCQLRTLIQREMPDDLADDFEKLACRHMGAVLVHVPKLDEDFCPALRVRPAVQGLEPPCFDFCDVIARLQALTVIGKHQRQAGRAAESSQKLTDGNIVRVGRAVWRTDVALNHHLRYPLIRHF